MAVYIGWFGAAAFVLALLALPPKLAWDKGYRAFPVWFLFALIGFLPALLVVLCLRDKRKVTVSASQPRLLGADAIVVGGEGPAVSAAATPRENASWFLSW